MAHDEILPDCRELFGEIKTKLDFLIDANNNKNCSYERHIEESISYRKMTDRHEFQLKDYSGMKKWFQAAMFTVIGGVAVWLISWGSLTNQVSVNTGRLTTLEGSHPRVDIQNIYKGQEAQAEEQKK